jgi:hypothetical protein
VAKGKPAPASRTATKPPKGKPVEAEELDLDAQFDAVASECDADVFDEAFGGTEARKGGGFQPPDGDYIFKIVDGSYVKMLDNEKHGKYPLFALKVSVEGADDSNSELVGTEFFINHNLIPMTDKKTKRKYILGLGTLMALYKDAFGSDPGTWQECCKGLATEGIGSEWNCSVKENKDGYPNYRWGDMIAQ